MAATPATERLTLVQIAAALDAVPTLSEVQRRLLALLDGSEPAACEVADLVARDPAIAGRLLRVANSAQYAPGEPVRSVDHAIVQVGFGTLRSIVLTVVVIESFAADAGGTPLVRRLWLRTAGLACVARRLAEETAAADPDEAFLVGLLWDLGKLLTVVYLPGVAQRVIAQAARARTSWAASARSFLEADDGMIAATALGRWPFAPALTAVLASKYGGESVLHRLGRYAVHIVDLDRAPNGLDFHRPARVEPVAGPDGRVAPVSPLLRLRNEELVHAQRLLGAG